MADYSEADQAAIMALTRDLQAFISERDVPDRTAYAALVQTILENMRILLQRDTIEEAAVDLIEHLKRNLGSSAN